LKEIIFASGNKGKIAEVKGIFSGTDYQIISLYDLGAVPDIIEDGDTFEENAKIKAKFIFDIYKRPVIADDSGLTVEQLHGAPGVYSARYAGENCTYLDNNLKLINALKDLPDPHKAKFVCCAVYLDNKNYYHQTGELSGRIISELKGSNGFGYDPVFIADRFEQTLAEMDSSQKNKMSHRALAFNKLKEVLIK